VSLFDLELVHNVNPGDVLATRTPPTAGQPGISVCGEPIAAAPGKPARLRTGPGACMSEDGNTVPATLAGHAVLANAATKGCRRASRDGLVWRLHAPNPAESDTISVSSVYYVRGDVGPRIGHIDFVGSVIVVGNVDRGYHVKAAGDVEIQGSMAGGDVDAGGNISVRYGIHGHDGHGSVTAVGTVRAKFIEFASVHAGGNVYASDGVVHSSVCAGALVEVLGRHGSIIGGRVIAREMVRARDVGSERGIATEVAVGADPALIAEAHRVRARSNELTQQLGRVQQRLAHLQQAHRTGRLNALGRTELVQFHDLYRALLEQRAEVATRQQEMLELLRALPEAAVLVDGTCHAGVRVAIGGASHTVATPWQQVQFRRNPQTEAVDLVGLAMAV
jgi:uncharacterized protein